MRTVGSFGGITFYTSMENGKLKALSFTNLQWSTSIDVYEHKRFGKKPYLETLSKNCDEIQMDIYIKAELGVKPTKTLLKLRSYNLNGKVYPLKIGGRRIGNFKWIITSISNDIKAFYKNGKITGAVASVTFKEYPYKKGKTAKKKVIKSVTSSISTSKNSATSSISTTKTGTSGVKTFQKSKGYSTYTVKKGDTLWDLAKKYYGDGTKYTKIFNANKTKQDGFNIITHPDHIEPGWVIKIPDK